MNLGNISSQDWSNTSFQLYQDPYSPPETPRKSTARTRDVSEEIEKEPALRPEFTDDQPFEHVVAKVLRKALVLECIAGLSSQNINGALQEFDGMVRLHAPHSDIQNEPQVDFVVLADSSGSMLGDKIDQLKGTMKWLIDNLGENHRMCVITFNDKASRKTPLTLMTAAGKVNQLEAVQSITALGSTDITAALSLAAAVINERRYKDPAAVVLLLTDGQDTAESTEQDRVQVVTSIASKALLACVGIGEDHDAALLSSISRRANGTFQYCPDAEAIAPTIGGIIGAATSVSALGVRLIIQAQGAAKIHEISQLSAGQTQLFPFRANQLFAPYAKVSVTYKEPGATDDVRVELEAMLPDNRVEADLATLVAIDVQKNRELAGSVLLQSADLAAQNEVDQAKKVLQDAISLIESSISAKDALCIQLIADCRDMLKILEAPVVSFAQALAAGASHSQQVPSQTGDFYATPNILTSRSSAKKSVNRTNN